ncbi:hypothetical protein KVA01_05200 [Kocuria varians]|uniref:Uncharacterized protein n=1 Tax=Kocuria varians TaxID=1272 RepID=A0A4Y4CZK0_KOCVA|nr:hypothetical protein KVA01_05200 [Kocuria varians]
MGTGADGAAARLRTVEPHRGRHAPPPCGTGQGRRRHDRHGAVLALGLGAGTADVRLHHRTGCCGDEQDLAVEVEPQQHAHEHGGGEQVGVAGRAADELAAAVAQGLGTDGTHEHRHRERLAVQSEPGDAAHERKAHEDVHEQTHGEDDQRLRAAVQPGLHPGQADLSEPADHPVHRTGREEAHRGGGEQEHTDHHEPPEVAGN